MPRRVACWAVALLAVMLEELLDAGRKHCPSPESRRPSAATSSMFDLDRNDGRLDAVHHRGEGRHARGLQAGGVHGARVAEFVAD